VASNMGAAAKTARAVARCYEKEGLESALYEKPHPGERPALDTGQNHRVNLCALTALGLAWRNQSLAAYCPILYPVGPLFRTRGEMRLQLSRGCEKPSITRTNLASDRSGLVWTESTPSPRPGRIYA